MTAHAGPRPRLPRARDATTPIVLMGYYNPIHAYGRERFLEDARSAGVDGLIVVDLPPEEDDELCLPARAARARLHPPRHADHRRPPPAGRARRTRAGFLYYVSVTGITGAEGGRGRPQVAPRWPGSAPDRPAGRRRASASASPSRRPRSPASPMPSWSARPWSSSSPGTDGDACRLVERCAREGAGLAEARAGCAGVNWLTNYVRPEHPGPGRASKPEVPENLWHQCPSCERMIFHRDLEQNQRVCPHCSFHMRVGPDYRFTDAVRRGQLVPDRAAEGADRPAARSATRRATPTG